MISKGCFGQISNIIIKSVFGAFLYLNPSSVYMILNWYYAHTLIKVTEKIILVHEIDLVSDHLLNTKRVLVTNQQSPELSLYALKPVGRTTFETP